MIPRSGLRVRPRGRGCQRSDHAVQPPSRQSRLTWGGGERPRVQRSRGCPLTIILGERRRRQQQQQQQQRGERQSGAHGCPRLGTRSRWLRRWHRDARMRGWSFGAARGGLATAANSGVAFRRSLLPAADLGWGAEPRARSEGGCGPGGVCAAAAQRARCCDDSRPVPSALASAPSPRSSPTAPAGSGGAAAGRALGCEQ